MEDSVIPVAVVDLEVTLFKEVKLHPWGTETFASRCWNYRQQWMRKLPEWLFQIAAWLTRRIMEDWVKPPDSRLDLPRGNSRCGFLISGWSGEGKMVRSRSTVGYCATRVPSRDAFEPPIRCEIGKRGESWVYKCAVPPDIFPVREKPPVVEEADQRMFWFRFCSRFWRRGKILAKSLWKSWQVDYSSTLKKEHKWLIAFKGQRQVSPFGWKE